MTDTRRVTRRKTSIRKGGRRAEEPPRARGELNLSPRTRALLKRFDLAPNKALGQNFLVDEFVLGQILAAAEVGLEDQVVEVGPGLGVLTEALAERARRVVAIEVDRGMAAALRELFAGQENVEIVEGDALTLDPGELAKDEPYAVVANIPYYISSPLMRHFFEASLQPTRVVVMVQREVAERIVAKGGDLSLLAISVQFYGEPRIVGHIPAHAFFPQPKVDSAILRVDVRDRPAIDAASEPFFRTVAAGFSMPRKQLHNALAQRIWFPPGGAAEALNAVGIEPSRRAQTLSLEEWAKLTAELQRRGGV